MQKYKIGVFGSSGSTGKDKNIDSFQNLAIEIGQEIAKKHHTLINGACLGLPYYAAKAAYDKNGKTWGFAAATDRKMLDKTVPNCDNGVYSKIIYVPKGFGFMKDILVMRKYRNVTSIAHCDAGIIISGKWGTMNEFTNLYDMGKVIGILSGTGGISDELPKLLEKIKKPSKAKVVFNKSPKKLLQLVIKELKMVNK